MSIQDLEGYGEVWAKFMPVEKRLFGLEVNEAVLALPNEILRGLKQEFIDSLPADVQAKIQQRLAQ